MSILSQRLLVPCPIDHARAHLSAYFRQYGNRDGDVSLLRLRAGGIEYSAIATFVARPQTSDGVSRYSVLWAPEGAGPYPTFMGTLTLEDDGDGDAFTLTVDGSYTLPPTRGGKAFDVLVAHRIANAAVSNLLADISDFILSRYAAAEFCDRAHERALSSAPR